MDTFLPLGAPVLGITGWKKQQTRERLLYKRLIFFILSYKRAEKFLWGNPLQGGVVGITFAPPIDNEGIVKLSTIPSESPPYDP